MIYYFLVCINIIIFKIETKIKSKKKKEEYFGLCFCFLIKFSTCGNVHCMVSVTHRIEVSIYKTIYVGCRYLDKDR